MELVTASTETRDAIRKKYDITDAQIARDVQIIKQWLVKQPHLPQNLPFDNFIEKVLLNSKFRVEIAKERIDAYFAIKNVTKDCYEIFAGPKYTPPLKNPVGFVALPRLGLCNERINLLTIINTDPDAYEFHHFTQITLALMELVMKYDYCDGLSIVADCSNYKLDHVKKFEVAGFTRTITMWSSGSWFRLVGFHFFNFKPYQSFLFKIIKTALKPKMAERFVIHDSMESLYRSVPRDCLPQEYGGTLGPLTDFVVKTNELVEDNRQYLIDCLKYASNESLRIGKPKVVTGLYGVDGTFKKLNVD